MTRITLTALLLGFFCFNNLQAESKSSINFQSITFSEVKTQAAQEQKHILAYIQGDWCLGCQIMEETTFIDQKLGEYVNNEFLAVKVDIHSALGKEWDDEFQITCLPTFLIFDKNGQILDRYETTFTGTALLQVLRESVEPGFVAQVQKGSLAAQFDSKVNSVIANQQTSPTESKRDNTSMSQATKATVGITEHLSLSLPDSNEQKIIDQHIAQLELLLQKQEDLTKQSANTEESDSRCQELFSNTAEIRTLIDALKAMKSNSSTASAPMKELVVAASVPLERQTSTEKIEPTNSNSTIKKLYAKGSHKVQLGQYSDYNEAAAVIKRIESKFESKEVFLMIDKKGSYSTYRVLVKGFDNQKEASDFIRALGDMGY